MRIKALEAAKSKGGAGDTGELQKRFKLVDDLYHAVQAHPEYTKTRKKRSPKS